MPPPLPQVEDAVEQDFVPEVAEFEPTPVEESAVVEVHAADVDDCDAIYYEVLPFSPLSSLLLLD